MLEDRQAEIECEEEGGSDGENKASPKKDKWRVGFEPHDVSR